MRECISKPYPKDGSQFAMVWEYNGRVWGGTFKFDKVLLCYDHEEDVWGKRTFSKEAANFIVYEYV